MTENAASERLICDLRDLERVEGSTFGPSKAVVIAQDRIQLFADATSDYQWIHVDPERAALGPFGTTIAHGYLTLSMIPQFLADLIEVTGAGMGINYGLNKVRFPAPLPSGAEIQAMVNIAAVRRSASGVQVTFEVAIETAQIDKPICVAEVVVLYAA